MSDSGYLGFVGVTTGSSSIMRIFPEWAKALDLPTRTIVGHDVAPNSSPKTYRALIEHIHADPRHYGALVTTHKMNVYESCRDLFGELDRFATLFAEISSVAKRGDVLTGAAKDPITVRLAYEEFLDDGYFARTGAHALCLGSGGSGAAFVQQLAERSDRPGRIVVTGRRQVKLDEVRDLIERSGQADATIEYVLTADADADRLVAALPAGSVIANSTGMGKDSAGSPLSDAAEFPDEAVIWDFNYRGSLEFLHQGRAQQARRGLTVVDGWRYFIHGWTQVISDVFDIPIDAADVERLSDIANGLR